MFYLIYQTTNLVNGKIYVGAHSTNDINDSYLGSGKLLHAAIKKYGIENFKREILEKCSSAEDMFKRESEIVNINFVARKDTYNLMPGGFGTVRGEHNPNYGRKHTEESIQKMKRPRSEGFKQAIKTIQSGSNNSFYGKTHSNETISKISEKLKGRKFSEETKKKLTESNYIHKRKAPHWEYYKELYNLWVSTGCLGWRKFLPFAVAAGYPDVNYARMVCNFKDDFNKEQ